jgi:hypothetical protein
MGVQGSTHTRPVLQSAQLRARHNSHPCSPQLSKELLPMGDSMSLPQGMGLR